MYSPPPLSGKYIHVSEVVLGREREERKRERGKAYYEFKFKYTDLLYYN